MRFGYMRVSAIDQNLDRQEQQLKDAKCNRIFFKKVTGTKRARPELRSDSKMRDANRKLICSAGAAKQG